MRNALLRAMHREEGYSLVISMLLMSIMMVLLAVSLDAGSSSLRQSSLSLEWSKALTVAEGGADAAVTTLGESRAATNSCAIGTNNVCNGVDGQYQVRWTTSGSQIVVTSVGYYPTKAEAQFAREVEITYEPVPSFKYALFSQTSLDVHNQMTVAGDVYSAGDVTVGNSAVVCGSIVSSGGGVSLGNSSHVVKSYAPLSCSGKSGDVWTGGSAGITGSNTVEVQGNLKASNPATQACSNTLPTYAISAGGSSWTIQGAATACGKITNVSSTVTSTGVGSSQPAPVTFPAFVFDPNNYPSSSSDPLHLQCYPTTTPITNCGANDATDAVTNFNTYVAAHKNSLTGTFAVWQRTPSSSTAINLDQIKLAGDFTLITNAPVNFGNTNTVTTTSSSVSADLVINSTYQPTGTCDGNGATNGTSDCSIYGKNAIEFDSAVASDPNDGVVGLLYTTGKMAFGQAACNAANIGDGALYAQSMSFNSCMNVIYNSRVERVLGFGASYEQVLWQELNI
jgi:hypothetical protein